MSAIPKGSRLDRCSKALFRLVMAARQLAIDSTCVVTVDDGAIPEALDSLYELGMWGPELAEARLSVIAAQMRAAEKLVRESAKEKR